MLQNKSASFTREDTKVVKAIAVILMVIHHLFAFPDRIIPYIPMFPMGGGYAEVYLANFGKICVTMFVFLGGYGTYMSCRGKSIQDLSAILVRKLVALYKQYWIVWILFLPLIFKFSTSLDSGRLIDLFWSFTGVMPLYVEEWWFFTPYVMLILFYPPLHHISSRFHCLFSEFIAVMLCNTFAMFIFPTLSSYAWAADLSSSIVYMLLKGMVKLLPHFWMGCLFAKYGILSAMKERLSGNALYSAFAFLIAAFCVYLRNESWSYIDIVLTPIFVASIIIALNHKPGMWIRKILTYIGTESTFIWLTHSIFCYKICQRLVFKPQYSVLIVLWLLVMCLVTAKALRLIMKIVNGLWKKLFPLFTIEPLKD